MIKKFVLLFIFLPKFALAACEKPEMPTDQEWQSWLDLISKEAVELGINKEIVANEIQTLIPLEKIILRDRCQPESTITFKEYLYYRLDKTRIYSGKIKQKEFSEILNEISSIYDIQSQYILAIWGMESYYGKNQGKSKVISVLGTLSYDRRRSEFYKKQFFAALKMLNEDLITSENLVGSWAGAMGQAQFLPTTYLDSAVDFDKDGKKDIWKNELDVLASIANYLTSIDKAPWDSNLPWGTEVIPPSNILSIYESLKQKNPKGCYAVKTMSIEKTLNEWEKIGFNLITNLESLNKNTKAKLVFPDGVDGKVYLVFQNYKSILYYNCSHYYALTIGLLSDKIVN